MLSPQSSQSLAQTSQSLTQTKAKNTKYGYGDFKFSPTKEEFGPPNSITQGRKEKISKDSHTKRKTKSN
ncbi:hypothetical protein GCM10010301_73690 [Streptomyces plicatus]|nr:hypothetical protein GCM10010301_73690 [Streptomyces plicatus]